MMKKRSRNRLVLFAAAVSGFILVVHLCYRISTPPPTPESRALEVPEYKYFDEKDGSHELAHYDSRYFSKIVSAHKRPGRLRDLIHSYLEFSEEHGIETWLAHGTLLGWWWNEKLLPWDYDIDVQVSVETLNRMGSELNQTVYTYAATNNSYLLDVNPWISRRIRGKGRNVIDVRWLDTSTGLFVDITGLAETDPIKRPGVIQCKNNHYYEAEDVYPLRTTLFEGRRAYVPFAYSQILRDEYDFKSLSQTRWKDYRWDSKAGEWVRKFPRSTNATDEETG